MPRYDFKSQRLFVEQSLFENARFEMDRAQANYLLNVLRLSEGSSVLLFNGREGEWQAELIPKGRKKADLLVVQQTRPQTPKPPLTYLFAPLKQARMEYMVQKAVEMGAGVLRPVFTDHTQMRRLNNDRMNAQIIEAAEQCGILSLPQMSEGMALDAAINALDDDCLLVFCDEGEESQNPLAALSHIQEAKPEKLAVLIGPEGGFSEAERKNIRALPNSVAIPLGPRVLRADTAAVAALAIVQTTLGDWF